jgi:hypothetical protein
MNREQAKQMAVSRDCHCIEGNNRDNNFNEAIDKVFDYFESKEKILMDYLTEEEFERTRIATITADPIASMITNSAATTFWEVKQFIEVNKIFKEEE